MIKGILFDFDGTLVDTNLSVCEGYRNVFKTFRPDYPITDEFLMSLLGPALVLVFPKYFKEDHDLLVKVYREGASSVMDKDHVKPFNNAVSVIKKLKENGIKVAVVSSRKSDTLLSTIHLCDMDNLFDILIGSDSVVKHKPDPEGMNLALNKLDLRNDEVLVIGDHYGDIKAAKAANIKSVGVSWSTYGKDNLIKDGADYIINDFNDLIDLVGELNG